MPETLEKTPTIKHHHEPIIEVKNLTKHFQVGKNKIEALRGVSFDVYPADFVIIFGPSGCGKSTLLNIVCGIDSPSGGDIKIRDTKIFNLSDDSRGIFRSKKMGIIQQLSNWIKSLNVVENIALPLIIEGISEEKAIEKALSIMDELKIRSLARQRPTQLSGGEQQKVGLARALVTNPWIILADEPTGNLDSTSSDEIIAIFDLLNRKFRRTIILVTHNQQYWTLGSQRIEMKDGVILKKSHHNAFG